MAPERRGERGEPPTPRKKSGRSVKRTLVGGKKEKREGRAKKAEGELLGRGGKGSRRRHKGGKKMAKRGGRKNCSRRKKRISPSGDYRLAIHQRKKKI